MRLTNYPFFDKRIIIFAGAYGSGKTEVAVNYALYLASSGDSHVSIADLDIVNPYFRSREAAVEMEAHGVNVIMPHGDHCSADLPIILPEIKGIIERSDGPVVLDVGGDDLGARVLSSLADSFAPGEYEFLMVLNGSRPFTSDVSGSIKMIREIEKSARLKFTGIVSNTHLIGETTTRTIIDGYNLAREVARKTGIPVVFVSAMEEIVSQLNPGTVTTPVLPLSRRMLKPWEQRSGSTERLVPLSRKKLCQG
jgi:hypothetical protein